MKKSLKMSLSPVIALTLTILIVGCGPSTSSRKGTSSGITLAQQSDSLSDNGDFLCRLDFNYPAAPGASEEVGEYIVKWGLKRSAQKKEILADCTNTSLRPRTAARVCAKASVQATTQCVHSSLLAASGTSRSGRNTKCELRYRYRFEGQDISPTDELIESTGTSLADGVKRAVDQCLSLRGGALDGCSLALINGALSCTN